jgi:REP element-mobilizing transposase RayT
MLTLVTSNRKRLFGTLTGDSRLPLHTSGCPRVELSPLGNAIRYEEIPKISRYYPMVEVWKVCIMPDHLHIIVTVKEQMPAGKHLGIVIKGFKQGCNKAYWRVFNMTSIHPSLFEPNYCDKILSEPGQLDRWKHYLDDNPRRLLIKTTHPELFSVRHHLTINGRQCVAVGNPFLLDIPDKEAVIVHRRDDENEYARKRGAWMATGANYGVLVGAFISPREREVKQSAMELGYFIIHLTNQCIGQFYKPSGMDFDACAEGRMLIISPWLDEPKKEGITRQECLELNALAVKMVQE